MWKQLAGIALLAACGGKQASTPDVPQETRQPNTCQDVGARTAKDIAGNLPEGVPADAGDRFGAMIAELCEKDGWPQGVIDCGMTAEKPREECSPQLSAEQRANIDAAQDRFGRELMVEMQGDTLDLLEPTGMAGCDNFRVYVSVLSVCKAAVDHMGEQVIAQYVAIARQVAQVPEAERQQADEACWKASKQVYDIGQPLHCFEY